MGLLPVALFGLEVPPGKVLIPIGDEFPATIRITMAAVDPTEEPEADEDGQIAKIPHSTLSIVKQRFGSDLDNEMNDEELKAFLGSGSDDDEDEEDDDDEEPNGGPSDPSKSNKVKRETDLQALLDAVNGDADSSDEEMDEDDEDDESPKKTNGVKSSKKGKEIALLDEEDEDEDDDSDSSDDDALDLERFVVCTLDTERNYQQPLDITLGENEKAFFMVSGTHTVHLTGNYVIDDAEEISDEEEDEDEEDDDYLPMGLEGEIDDMSDDESDVLDLMTRITEVADEDEDEKEQKVPKLVKGKNKRLAEEEAESLDELMAKEAKEEAKEEPKLSKKQLKKLKNNKGNAIAVKEEVKVTEEVITKSDKKVQFAKNLEQGPTGSTKVTNTKAEKPNGVKTVYGVTLDDRKVGAGRVVKPGDRVGVRYIGKLKDGKVFDSNKKGTPFRFKVGKGEVIKGWDIGVVGMSVGGERRLIIPAHHAYGSQAQPGIPANSELVFDVKLLEIQ